MISTFTAFFDSNAFYGARLRSLLLFLARTGLFRARWSEDIHNEWIDSLLKNRPDLNVDALAKTRQSMDDAVLDCLVTGYKDLIPGLTLPDEKDRHVLAAAICARASVIVTFNEKDFPPDVLDRYGIHTRTPDDFVMDVIGIDEAICLAAIDDDITHYANPPQTIDDYIAALEKAGLPKTAAFLKGIRIVFEEEEPAKR
jgi:hypothetical protein